jgi:hypothetical protein
LIDDETFVLVAGCLFLFIHCPLFAHICILENESYRTRRSGGIAAYVIAVVCTAAGAASAAGAAKL